MTVLDLQNELERITSVPIKDQKLYFKSLELNQTPFKTLKECEVVNTSSIKMVGEPTKMRYSNYFGRLNIPITNSNQNEFYGQPFNNNIHNNFKQQVSFQYQPH